MYGMISFVLSLKEYQISNTIRSLVTVVSVKGVSCVPRKFKFFELSVKSEHRTAIKFCYYLKRFVAETIKLMHDAYINAQRLGLSQSVTVTHVVTRKCLVPLQDY